MDSGTMCQAGSLMTCWLRETEQRRSFYDTQDPWIFALVDAQQFSAMSAALDLPYGDPRNPIVTGA